ncbi:MAG: histidine kinase dimerization/phospho-acceptor domain-containing protein, partial [Candidatus Acidiferrales bacterium]
MRITRRTKAIAFFIALGVCLVALAVALNVTWVIDHWRQVVPLILGFILFGLLIAGLTVNTIFLVREIRRNEQQDSFLNAVTHELKTPIASIRLYLETLQSRKLDDAKRLDFYRIMLEDTDRLLGTVDQVLKAGEVKHGIARKNWQEVQFSTIVRDVLALARVRQNLSPEALRLGVIPPAEITVMGNPEELRTAVFNL